MEQLKLSQRNKLIQLSKKLGEDLTTQESSYQWGELAKSFDQLKPIAAEKFDVSIIEKSLIEIANHQQFAIKTSDRLASIEKLLMELIRLERLPKVDSSGRHFHELGERFSSSIENLIKNNKETVTVINSQPSLAPNMRTSTTLGSSSQTIDVTYSVVLSSNDKRKRAIVQNTGTTIIYIGLGTIPTTNNYTIALAACTLANDGTGGVLIEEMWQGAINAISSAVSGAIEVTELR